MEEYFPSLPSATHDVRDELIKLRKFCYDLQNKAEALAKREVLSPAQAAKLYSPETQKQALQVQGGKTSLNINGLPGRASEPQFPFVEEVLTLPNLQSPLSQNGNLISFEEVLYRFDGYPQPGSWVAQGAIGVTLQDNRANFLANYNPADYPVGTTFWITDWTVLYQVVDNAGTKEWHYRLGTYSNTLANIPTLAAADTNFLFNVTDYAHVLKWSGSAWGWGPGEIGSGYYGFWESAPTSNGWQVCDGTAVNRLNADGTVTNVTTPNVTTPRVIVGGLTAAAVAGATGSTGSTDLAPTTNLFTLDAGGSAAVTGFTNPHSHTAGTSLPPSKQTAMYYRR